MHVLVYILLWTTVCCYRCFHERQSYTLERPIGWLGSNERKYCQLKAGNVLWIISSRFREIYHLIECHISLWPDFALSSVFLYLSCYKRQVDKSARPIGWLGSCERKYCLLCREKVSWKNFEPFWRNITSKIVMSWKLLPKFRQITWFCYLCFYGCQADKPARPIGWLGACEKKYCLLGAGKVL